MQGLKDNSWTLLARNGDSDFRVNASLKRGYSNPNSSGIKASQFKLYGISKAIEVIGDYIISKRF